MKFNFALSAIFALSGAYGSPVGSTFHALAKLFTDLNSTAIYFRNINPTPSEIRVKEAKETLEVHSSNPNAAHQLAQGLTSIQEILEDITYMNSSSRLELFVIPELQMQLKERIDALASVSVTGKIDNGVQATINSLSKSLYRAVKTFNGSHWTQVCGGNSLSKRNPVKDAAQDNLVCDVLQILFYITYYGLSNLNGSGYLIYEASIVFGCHLAFL